MVAERDFNQDLICVLQCCRLGHFATVENSAPERAYPDDAELSGLYSEPVPKH